MKVRCLVVPPVAEFRPHALSRWLEVGAEYEVLELSITMASRVSLHIVLADGSFGIFPAGCFEPVDSELPSDWAASRRANGGFRFGPAAWAEDGFWEAYYDQEPHAVEAVKDVLRARHAAED